MQCPECGAENGLCRPRFDELLALEFSHADYGAVHHLTVAAYILQHSSRLTRAGWLSERELLREFLVENKSPARIRMERKRRVDSGRRDFRIRSRDGRPVIEKTSWDRTILDVRTADAHTYCLDVTAWAASVLAEAERLEPAPDR